MRWLLILALIISLSFGLQHIIGLIKNPFYTPFALVGISRGGSFDEAYCYVPSINASRFDKSLADWQVFEYRNGPKVQPILGPLIFGRIAKIIGLKNLYIMVDFIFPPLIFLLFYYLVNLLVRNKLLAVFSSLLLLGQEPLTSFAQKFGISLLKYDGLNYFIDYLAHLNRPLTYARFDNPQFSFLLLLLGILLLWQSLKKGKLFLLVLTGFILGLQWYVYSYYAIFATLILFILPLVLFFSKYRTKIKSLFIAAGTFLITSLYYWFNYWQFVQLPQAREFLLRAGREDGRWFDKNSLFIILLVLLIILVNKKLKKKIKNEQIFIISLLLAIFSCLNFQILSGFSMQHFHWQSVIVNPIIILAEVYLLSLIITDYYSKFFRKGILIIILMLVASIFFRNLFISLNTYKAYTQDYKIFEAFNWLNKNTGKDSVVMTPSLETNYLLIIYTHNYIFTPHALHSLAPTSELMERMAITFNIFGISSSYTKNFLTPQKSLGVTPYTHQTLDLAGYPYLFYLKHGLQGPKNEEAQKEILESLKIFRTVKLTLPEISKKYKVDYLFFGPSEKRISTANFDLNPKIKKVFDNEEIKIYQLL